MATTKEVERACETCQFQKRDNEDCWECLSDSPQNPLPLWKCREDLMDNSDLAVRVERRCGTCKYYRLPLTTEICGSCRGDRSLPNWERSKAKAHPREPIELPPNYDPVNSPSHYQLFPDGTEAIDIIRTALTPEEFAGYCKGNFLKYRLRAGAKDDLEQDINKSNKYVEFMNVRY